MYSFPFDELQIEFPVGFALATNVNRFPPATRSASFHDKQVRASPLPQRPAQRQAEEAQETTRCAVVWSRADYGGYARILKT